MIDARNFSPDGQHAGTEADPWPGVAIKNAIDYLNNVTDIVRVANGIWKLDSQLKVERSNWTLQGESRDGAVLRCEATGQLWFTNASSARFEILTLDCNNLPVQSPAAGLRFSNAQNCSFTGNKILGHANGGMPGMFWEGGQNNEIRNNTFLGAPAGGDNTCQVQPLGGTADSNFVIADNTCDSTYIVAIGISNLEITNNILNNATMGNSIGIQVCGKWDQECSNVLVDGNTVDAGGANGCAITGLPNDPGGASLIRDFRITNNTLSATQASIHCQSFDGNNYNDNTLLGNEKHNVIISGNKLHSAWSHSGIDCRGGAGLVDTVLIENNTLTNDAGKANLLEKDANTKNLTVRGNTGIPNDDGTEPEPIPPDPEPEPPEKNTICIAVNADPPGSVRFVLAGATPTATPASAGKKPARPPAQPPMVTIAVDCQPPDTSKIVFVGNATGAA